MNEKISVFIKEPGESAYLDTIDNDLTTLQDIVEGCIETFTVCSDLVVISNDEARIWGLPDNCKICSVDFCGTIILAGVDGEEFSDVPMSEKGAKKLFPQLFTEN